VASDFKFLKMPPKKDSKEREKVNKDNLQECSNCFKKHGPPLAEGFLA
jgi:hypothetical protein